MFNLFPALVWGQSNSSDFSWSGRWQHTDIDWFWFYSSLPLPPQTDNLLHCSTSNYSTFSWHYYGQSDPALADPNFPPLIKDYINWEARVQPIGGPFLFSINNEFSPFSLQFYPKVGLPDHNLRKFEFATALVPHLAGDNKFNYFWDENQGTWKETELIMEVTP